MMMVDFSIFGSVRAFATLSSWLRASAVSSAELNAKFMRWSNDPGLASLTTYVMPRRRRLATGIAHCGSSAQTISSTDSSSADTAGAPSATHRQPSSRYAYRAGRGDFGWAAAVEAERLAIFLGMGASVLGCR